LLLQAPVNSWQTKSSATFATAANGITDLGASAAIPASYRVRGGGVVSYVSGPDSSSAFSQLGGDLATFKNKKEKRTVEQKRAQDRARVAAKRQANPLIREREAERKKWKRSGGGSDDAEFETWLAAKKDQARSALA